MMNNPQNAAQREKAAPGLSEGEVKLRMRETTHFVRLLPSLQ
jgi:hypothetical protein